MHEYPEHCWYIPTLASANGSVSRNRFECDLSTKLSHKHPLKNTIPIFCFALHFFLQCIENCRNSSSRVTWQMRNTLRASGRARDLFWDRFRHSWALSRLVFAPAPSYDGAKHSSRLSRVSPHAPVPVGAAIGCRLGLNLWSGRAAPDFSVDFGHVLGLFH